jgi:hypothetical protein
MQDSSNQLDCWKQPHAPDVDAYEDKQYGPHQNCAMPSLRLIVFIIKDNQALDLRGSQVSDARRGCLPGEYRDPT